MGALDGYKILDFTTLLPGPYATMTLADMGAEVLKVSGKDKYDLVVNWPPEQLIRNDIKTGNSYVCTNDNEVQK